VSVRDEPDFNEKLEKLQTLLDLRGEPRTEIDQRYLTVDGIINRIDILKGMGLLSNHRILLIGDADLTGLAIAIFGDPTEVVVTDIDDRLSEIYFEANMEYDLPVRYVYHDMRIKIIAILRKQYSVVICEPPRTPAGIRVFLSRAAEIIENGDDHRILISLPYRGELIEPFHQTLDELKITDFKIHKEVNHYVDGDVSSFIELNPPEDVEPVLKTHHIRPFYEHEYMREIDEYKCVCRKSFYVGKDQTFITVDELEEAGCDACGYKGVFAYKSNIPIQ